MIEICNRGDFSFQTCQTTDPSDVVPAQNTYGSLK